jgi:hypothetical protein
MGAKVDKDDQVRVSHNARPLIKASRRKPAFFCANGAGAQAPVHLEERSYYPVGFPV